MARGRSRYQKGRVVPTEAGGREIHYNVYLSDPKTGKPKRHHRSRVVGYRPKMRRAEAEGILAAELAAINGGPITRPTDGTITFGQWMRNFYIPMRGANWRDATRASNNDYLDTHVYPALEHVALKRRQQISGADAAQPTGRGWLFLHDRLSREGSHQGEPGRSGRSGVLERNVARKTVILEIEESDKPVLPVEMYAKLRAGLDWARDRAIFMIACFCALRPSELFGLTWSCYNGDTFKIVNTAWRGRPQRKKIKRRNRYGRINYRLIAIPTAVRLAIDAWRKECVDVGGTALMFPGSTARGRRLLDKPMHPDNWLRLRLYPVVERLKIPFHPTFQVLRRSFSTHGKKDAHPTEMQAQLGHSDIRTTLDIYTRTLDPEVLKMANQVRTGSWISTTPSRVRFNEALAAESV